MEKTAQIMLETPEENILYYILCLMVGITLGVLLQIRKK
jgi:hypothetical protein